MKLRRTSSRAGWGTAGDLKMVSTVGVAPATWWRIKQRATNSNLALRRSFLRLRSVIVYAVRSYGQGISQYLPGVDFDTFQWFSSHRARSLLTEIDPPTLCLENREMVADGKGTGSPV
jgi:hypothetical protein